MNSHTIKFLTCKHSSSAASYVNRSFLADSLRVCFMTATEICKSGESVTGYVHRIAFVQSSNLEMHVL